MRHGCGEGGAYGAGMRNKPHHDKPIVAIEGHIVSDEMVESGLHSTLHSHMQQKPDLA
jgi:diphthamide synthase (EF-2-diphthine--ammonia ligase)